MASKLPLPGRSPKLDLKPETECFYCKGTGHLKRNCPKYLADKKDGKVNKGICVIDVYLTNARSSAWVFDTGSVAHVCNSKQGLRIKRRLAKDGVTMRVGNGSKVDVITVGMLPLHPSLSMNIISRSCLMRDNYSFKLENNGCSIYMSYLLWSCTLDEWSIFVESRL